MLNTYIDIFDYIRSPSGLEWQSLVGNAARFTTVQAQGASALTVPASGLNSVQIQLNMFDRITIFDGSNTEVVQVGSAGAAPDATSIPLLAGTTLQFAHAIGVAWCSDGAHGSLADQVVAASSTAESICYQSLLQATYTGELLDMPGIRASLSNRGSLTFRPRHWPLVALSGLAIATTPTSVLAFDTTQAFIGSNKRIITVKNLVPLPNQPGSNLSQTVPGRSDEAELQVTYQAGYTYNQLPGDFKEAVILVASDMVGKRHNPVGAADIGDGSSHISAALRGDFSGESIIMKRAIKIFSKYSTEVY